MSTKKCAIPPTAKGRGFPCEGKKERKSRLALNLKFTKNGKFSRTHRTVLVLRFFKPPCAFPAQSVPH